MAIEVKPLLPHEWPTLKQVRLRALADSPDAFSTTLAQAQAYSDDDWRTRAGRFALGPPAAMCIAYMDGMPCGMMSCYPAASAKQAAELTAVWVDPAARGQGVADALVASIVDWARAQGFALLQAWVVEDNPRAIAFYKKVGFAETGPREPVGPGSPHSMVLLAQKLRPPTPPPNTTPKARGLSMSSLYFFVGIMVVSLVIITLVSALEKRMVWPYVPAAEAPPGQCPPPDAYATANAAAATAAGFQWLGTYADAKGKIYRVRYDFFRAPSGDLLATVGTGTIASISMQTTWLHTLLSDGRCLVTFNHQNSGEIDLAGVAEEALIGNLGLAGMVDAHRARIGASGRTVEVFQEGSPLADLRAYRQRRTKRLVALGYASFLDREDNIWRYSLKGAATLAFRQYFTALRRVFVPDKARPVGSGTS